VTDLAFDTDAVGRWTAPLATTIERRAIQAYAEATNDDMAAHRRGDLAPAVFAAVPTTPVLVEAVRRLTRANELPRTTVHAGHDIRIARPLTPGARVVSRARVVAVEPKESGTLLMVQSETRGGSEVLNEQLATLFVGGVVARRRAGDRPSPQTPSGGLDHDRAVRVTMPVDADQPRRYSVASGDMNPAHLDESAARQAGFPGVIVHGLCTMAFCARAVLASYCADDPTRLRRIAVRFAAPVFPGHSLTTSVWRVTGDSIAYEARSAGRAVVTDGRAQLREDP
jgi:acyl dehydratase